MANTDFHLQQIGLTINEIKVYKYLLEKGESTGGKIYRENKMDKSSAYDALHGLEEKGLVYSLGEVRNQLFGATHVTKLNEIISEKESQLKEVKEEVADFIAELTKFARENYKSKNISVIEGPNAYKQWAFGKLDAPKGSTIREIVSFERHEKYLPDTQDYVEYSKRMPEIRAKKGIRMKSMIQYPEEFSRIINRDNKSSIKHMKESRVMPKGLVIPASIAIYGAKTSLMSERDGQFIVITIDNQPIASVMTILFEHIWKDCREV